MKPFLGVARPGWIYFLPVAFVAALLYIAGWWIPAVLVGILAAYVIYFFRDPERRTPGIPNSICSPADGKVVSVLEVPCDRMPEGRALRVAIFLNVFNVHVQRAPLAGCVTAVERRAGQKGNAMNEKCSEENEAVTIWMETMFGPIGVRQIAGAIARRIVCMAREGDELQRGDRYGLIQFGSRVELFLPLSASIKVHPGQKVVGGQTCLGVMYEDEVRKGFSREMIARSGVMAQTG